MMPGAVKTSMNSHLGPERGMTLVESLVVIAVIAMLAALLLPALSTAKQKERRTTCMNNTRQLSLLVRMYSDDSNDTAPNAPWTTNSSAKYLDGSTAFKRLLGNPGISNLFRCPADAFYYRYGTNEGGGYVPQRLCEQPISEDSSYGFNGGQRTIFETNTVGIAGRKLSSIKDPFKTVLVAELPAYFPWSWHQPKPGVPLFNDAKNVVGFVDGHISYIRIYWDSKTSGDFALQYNPPAGYDYKWSAD
jgi:prepilin-type N-terminal cleavage/methylation domain-containing protein